MPYINTGKSKLFYFGAHPSKTDRTFVIDNVGITYPSPDYYIERGENSTARKLGIYVFEYVTAGKGTIEQGDRIYHVQAGDFYLLNCRYDHKYYPDKRDPFSKLWINAGGTLVDSLLGAYGLTDPVIVKHIDVHQIFEETIDLLRNYGYRSKGNIADKIALKVCELVLAVHASERPADNNLDSPARRIKRYIDSQVNFGVTLEDIERQFNINKSYIIHLFKRSYNTTPKQYILQKKIEAAKMLLTTKENQIKEISVILCFSSSQHFSSVFKRIVGMTPDEYRRQTAI